MIRDVPPGFYARLVEDSPVTPLVVDVLPLVVALAVVPVVAYVATLVAGRAARRREGD